jgi:hypothetical protein
VCALRRLTEARCFDSRGSTRAGRASLPGAHAARWPR